MLITSEQKKNEFGQLVPFLRTGSQNSSVVLKFLKHFVI